MKMARTATQLRENCCAPCTDTFIAIVSVSARKELKVSRLLEAITQEVKTWSIVRAEL